MQLTSTDRLTISTTETSTGLWQNIAQYLWNLDANNAFTFRLISETQKNTYEGFSATGRGICR